MENNKRGLILFIVIFLMLVSLISVMADGGYFPRPGYWVRPGQQRAIIFHEGNIETLILTSGFQGNAKELVWIIPTPTKPEVTKANEKVFTNVAKLAQQRYDYGYGYGAMKMAVEGTGELGVVVIESKQVDYYDVNILLATNSQDLVKWFNDNNYQYPEEYAYVLNHYIQKGWYFTAIKVSPEAQGATEVIQDLKEGHPTPVKMVFLSEKIVFPLKISSVDFPKKGDVLTKIGCRNDYNDMSFTGTIDEVKIWSYTLSDSEILNEYNSVQSNTGSLISGWKFENNLLDSQGNYNGISYGNPSFVSGKVGNALNFDGNDCVYLEGNSDSSSSLNRYNKDLTIGAWVKWSGAGGTIVARAKPNYIAYWLRIEGNKACARVYNGEHHQVCSSNILKPDSWYYITGVFDRVNGEAKVYVNGVLEASGSLPEAPPEDIYDPYSRYGNYIPIQLYVIADGKYEADEFYVQYGNWVKKSQIEDLGDDENGKPFIQPKSSKYYLTSLSASMQKSQMDDDVFLKKSDDNKKVNAGPETWQLFLYGLLIGFILFIVWIFTPLGIMFIAGTLILFLSSNKIARVFGWIMEIISFVITLIIGIIIFTLAAVNNSLGNYIVLSMLITCLLLLGIMGLLIILQRKYKKEK